MNNSTRHSRASGNPDEGSIWMSAFAGMTRFFLILAIFFWGLVPLAELFAAQSDSVILKVKVIDSAPTGSISINNGDEYTISTSVVLTLSAQDSESSVVAMQFSNDRVNWSTPEAYISTKIWDLPAGNGEKTVYVKFADSTGHWSQTYSDTIMLYEGTLIDPTQDVVVYSADGKIKLTIPANSIILPNETKPATQPLRISLIPLDITELEEAAPENYSIDVAVQCEPAGSTFKHPAILTIFLNEVPGTIIRLAYRQSSTETFTLLGRTSPVMDGENGSFVEFKLASFSTYAGLSSMLSQGAPIGAGVKVPLPDMLTGAFSHSIPITLPPGRKNTQPNLTLQYRSSNPNSWVGFGWSLNPGYIVRSTKLGPPSYNDADDTFIFVTDSGSTELVHLIDNLYQAKIESSFAKFYKETDDSWKVVQKDGTTLKFGETADSKETSDAGTFLWNLTRVTDNNKNYIALNYTKEEGKSYLYYIDYTGNEKTGTSPANTIKFTTEDRPDIISSFISGSEIKIAKRLKEIEVTQNNDLVWRYVLVYEYSADTNRSLLKSVTQYSSDGKAFPTQTFRYQKNK